MKEMITKEFLEYKRGFIDGKRKIIDAFKLGNIIDLSQAEEKETVSTWYSYGYSDSIKYFSGLIDTFSLDLEKMNTQEITKEFFIKKVYEINQEQGSEIAIGRFKM